MISENNSNQYLNEEEASIDLLALVNILLGKWYWFVLSVFLCGCLSALAVYKMPKVFRKSATILIKDSKNGSASQALAFADLAGASGLATNNTENEMLVLRSRTLMEKVVADQGLHITYYVRQYFRWQELYETVPFKLVEAEKGTLMPTSFIIVPQSESVFQMQLADTVIRGEFNREIRFPFGIATIESYPQLLRYAVGKEIQVHIATPKRIAGEMLSGLNISQISKGASMLSVSMNASRPGKSADVLNTLFDLYNQDAVKNKNQVLDNTDKLLQERLETIRFELGEVDGRIEGFKRSTLSTDIQSESQTYLQSASNLEERLSEAEIQISLVNILYDFLRKPANKRELLPYNIGLDNAGLNAQIQYYNDNLIRFNRMIAASSERNPLVADLSVSLESVRASIEKTVQDMKRSLELRQKELGTRTLRTTGRIEAASTNERTIQSITRDQKIKAELYLYLLNKLEENAIVKSTTEPNARIIDRAFGSDAPISPKREMILLVGVLIGLILPAAWFILKDLLYTKVRGRSDVTKVVKAPLLGEIPSKSTAQKDQFMVVRSGNSSQLCESFRILRTNLNFLNPDGENKVLSFTSTLPGEGKTYVSANMAMALALSGKRVCLVGLDLRRPTLQAGFDMQGFKGVSDYLIQPGQSLSSLIQPTQMHENLFLLPAGTIPPNPAELLISSRFEEMVSSLRAEFDYVVLDNPPMNIVSDTGIANRVADITLYVIRAGYLNRRELSSVQALYQEKKLQNMGVIITDVDYERLYYSVGYSGYGKRYGYSGGDYNRCRSGYYSVNQDCK